MKDGKIKRSDIFITTKLWNANHDPKDVEPAIKKSINDLKCEYIDLYLIHWPVALKDDEKDENGKHHFSMVDYVDTWKAMEALVQKGLAKSIGLSNFNHKQIQRVLDAATIKPANLQVEIHPYLSNAKLVEFTQKHGITVTAYSPLGSYDREKKKPEDPEVLEDKKLKELAEKYKKTVAQIALRWNTQRGIVVIPKSVKEEHIKGNIQLFDWKLSDEDFKTVEGLNIDKRFCLLSDDKEHPYWPFNEEY